MTSETSSRGESEANEREELPISALQHLLFCERQCGLIHLENHWKENLFTAEGKIFHERAHDGPDENRSGVRIARGLPITSRKLGLRGICDVVEFHQDGSIIPIEYKRGRPKSHHADEVQLCAQSLCLEEMIHTTIPYGYLFYGQPKRRTQVSIDSALRSLTEQATTRLHNLINTQQLPKAEYNAAKCKNCSLQDACQPRTIHNAKQWFQNKLQHSLETEFIP